MAFYAYMLRCSDGSYYVGHTDDLEARFGAHQSGLVAGYTQSRLPVKLVWSQEFSRREEAVAAERQIKGWGRRKKEALIAGDWDGVRLLSRKLFTRSFDTPPAAATQDERGEEVASSRVLDACVLAARAAGAEILKLVAAGFEVEAKGDASPVTVCDRAAEAIILAVLAEAAPGVPVVAEEECAAGRVPDCGDAWFLVDPLDGTKEFVRGGEDYTVNIGLIERGTPVLGVVYQPATGTLWAALAGAGTWRERDGERVAITVRAPYAPPPVAVASKSHFSQNTADYLALVGAAEDCVSVGSSLKFCIVAEGGADIYPRLSPTCEWDTAAGHAILLAAGGRVDGPDGAPLAYGKPDFLNAGFCATGGWQAPPVGPYLA
jgi:3'(2'), 5'-bisphosphate nucleotidase